MKDPKDRPPDFTDLRRRAEEQLRTEAVPPEDLSPDEAARLIHELQVYQIELEMQNDELRRSQALLEESRSKYADLYDFAPVGHLTLDPRGMIVEANLTAATLLGVERSKLVKRFFSHFLVEADRRVFRQLMNNGLNHRQQRVEVHLQDGGGNLRVMLLDILFLTDAEGQMRRRVSLTDITELQRTHEELRLRQEELEERTAQLVSVNEQLRKANDNLEALFKAAPLAIGVFDDQGRLLKINPASERIFGWTLAEVEGRQPLSIPPEAPEESLAVMQRVLQGESFVGAELQQQRQDGAQIDVSFSAAPVYDAGGNPRGFIGLAEDITERKKLEEAVRTQAKVLENMAEGVTVTDHHGEIVYTNPAFDAMFGYEPGELVGRSSNILNYYPPEENLGIVKEILRQVNTTGLWTGEFRNCRKNGSPFYTLARISSLRIGGKKLYISVQEDITQRKRAQEILQRQAELLDLAHDAILVQDLKGRITYWNQGAAHQYGWSKEEAMGQVSRQLLKTSFPQSLKEIERQVLEHGYWEGELTHTTRQGQRLVMNSRWTVKRDAEGRVVSILEISQDITAQKHIEQEVHRLASFPLLNPNPVLEVDEDGEVTYGNPAAREIANNLGLTAGVKAFLPENLKEIFAAAREGGPREYIFDLSLKGASFAVTLHLPHDLPTARLYALDITERKQAEEALRESEGRERARAAELQAILDTTPGVIFLAHDPEGRVITGNRSAYELLRRTPGSNLSKSALEGERPENFRIIKDGREVPGEELPVQRAAAGETVRDYELDLVFGDGTVRHILGNALPLLDETGRPRGSVAAFLDITERKRAEEALARRQAEFEAIFNSISDGVVFTDTQRHIALVNPAAEALFGYAPEEMQGRLTELLYASQEDFEEQGRRRYHLQSDQPQSVYEITYRRKDGSIFPAEARGGQVRDAHGRVLGFVSINRDITARQRIEEALREALDHFQTLFATSPLPTLTTDLNSLVTSWNPAAERLFGWQAEEVVGGPLPTVSEEDREELTALFQQEREGQFFLGKELRRRTRDGSLIDVSLFSAPLRDAQGTVIGFMGILEDITERKRGEAALRESREHLNRAQAVAHTGSWRMNVQKNELTWSEENHRIFGIPQGTPLTYETFLDTVHPEDREYVDRKWTAALRGEPYDIEHRIVVSGTVKWVRERAELEFDSRGHLLGGFGTTQDITARKRAEEALIQAKEEWERTFDAVPDFIAILDKEHRITRMNKAMTELLGKPPEEVIGQPCYRKVHGLDQAPQYCPHSLAVDTEKVTSTEVQEFGRIFAVTVSPIFGPDGQLTGGVHVARDITERKQAEEALREREAKLSSLFAAAPVGIGMVVNRVIMEVNQRLCQMTGYAPEELLGKSARLLYPTQEDFDYVGQEKYRQIAELGLGTVETRWQRKNGAVIDILLSSAPLTPGDASIGMTFTALDITERKRAEEEIEAHRRLLETVLTNLPSGVVLYQGPDHVVELMNPAFRAIAPGKKFLGRPFKDVWPEVYADVGKLFQRVLATGEPHHATDQKFLIRRSPAGPLETAYFSWSLIRVRLPGQKGWGILNTAIETTERVRAAEALRESEERYRSLFENNHAVMLLLGPETGAIVDANPAASAYYGYSREELLGRSITDINTMSPLQVKEEMQQAKAEARQHFEFKHRLASGVIRYVEVFSGPIRLQGRELLYSIVHDITARKEAEDAVRESEARFRSLFENMTEGVALHEMVYDDQGLPCDYRILATNPAFTVHTGFTADQVQGRLASEAYGTGEAPYLETYARVAHIGQPEVFETYFAPLKRHFSISTTSPKPGHFVTVFEDITARKLMEEALRRAKDELEQRVEERTAALRLANEQLLREIEERRQVEDRLRDSEARFAAFMEYLPGLAVMRDMEGRYLFANLAWEEMMGLPQGAWQGKSLDDLWPPERAAALQELDFQIISSAAPTEQVEVQELADGPHYFLTSRFPIRDAEGLPYMVGAIAIDVTDRQRAEQQVAETARLYRVLSQVNEAIMRGRDQESLFEQVCRIAVEEGLFGMAWVGLTDPVSQTVRVAAKYGFEEGYLDDLVISVGDGDYSRGPTGTAIRENRYDICNDFEQDPRMAPWQEQALARGYRSSGAFPLRIGGRVVGALTLYSHRPGFFTAKEITLLTSLADNLSFALESLDRESKRHQAEEALAEQAMLVHDLYNSAPCGYHSLDSEGYIAQINDTELAWLGYTRDEVVGRLHFSDLLTEDSRRIFEKTFPKFKARGLVKDIEYELVRKDGTVFPVNLSATAVTDEAGNYLMSRSSLFDITDRKRAEVALAQNEAMLRLILDTLPVGVWVTDREGRIIQGNPAAQQIWGGARYVGVEKYGEYQGWWADTGMKIKADEWALARAIRKGETSLGEVIDIQSFDGARKTIINSAVPLFAENREILGAIVVNQDITEMVRAEEVMREQARLLEAFFAHSLTPLVFLDRHFNFLRVNEAYARACQRDAQAFIGHNHFEFYPHPENQAIFTEAVRSKTPYQVQAKPFEFPDHPEWGVTYWDWSLVPILDQAGEVDFLVVSLRDVTRRVLSEQARNRLIEILEATPDFVGIADFYGRLQYLNRAGRALVGVGEDEDISRLQVLDLHPEWVGRLILERGSPTAIREGAWQAELALLHRDGREIPVSQVILAHKDPEGRVQFFSTVARDISDMKEAQANILRQAAILDGINRIFRETLTCETARELGQSCLYIAEALTKSQFGFITEINQQNRLDALALSDPGWQSCGLQPARDLSHVKDLEPKGLLARPIREGRAVIANAPASQPDWAGTLVNHSPLTAYLGTPLVYGGKTLGLLGLANKKGGYTLTDQEAVESLAPAIVEALMHHRAEEALKGSERKLRYLADQLLTAQENERKRLASELHDELGHALLALKLHLSSIEKKLPPEHEEIKEEIRSQLDYIHEVIQDVRRLYHDLSPGDVEDLGLTKALRTLINDFAGHFPQISWQVDLPDLEGLFSLPVQTTIYRIVQEALTNIGKHANPTAVSVSSTRKNHQVQFIVQDNGAGFDVAAALGSRNHSLGVGLVAMEERLNMVGGSFEIQSRDQEGTRLSFTIPAIPEGEKP